MKKEKMKIDRRVLPVATPVCVWQAFTTLAAVAIILSDTKLGRVCKHKKRAARSILHLSLPYTYPLSLSLSRSIFLC